ncbi:endonuclease domain-containing 1 protein-like, partial [Huso huso]
LKMNLLLITLCLISVWLACAKVVDEFEPDCAEYFYNGKEPDLLDLNKPNPERFRKICQQYQNRFHFATLYDTVRRTPVYSAYRWRPKSQRLTTGEPHQCRSDVWMYEPKLAYPKGNADEMQEDRELFDTQAMDDDYKDSGYTRGHLNPNSHQWDGFSQCSTFTMTNIVPQHKKSNSPPWSDHENKILKRLEQYCKSDAYIVTGVMPYINDKWIQKGNLRRVAIPEYLWSAYCCREFTNGHGQEHLFPTFAVIGRNDKESDTRIVKNEDFNVQEMSLSKLELFLKKRLGLRYINVFYNKCN